MKYEIERLGDISGKTLHNSLEDALTQLRQEYPRPPDLRKQINKIIKSNCLGVEDGEVLRASGNIVEYLRPIFAFDDRFILYTPDPEDDRILIWEIDDTGNRRVVWHFSGWHWEFDASDVIKGGLPQGILSNNEKSLYEIASEF